MFIQGSYYIVLQLYIRSARQIPKFLSGISVIFRAPYKWVLQNTIKYDDGNLEFVKGILHVFWTKMLSAAVPGFLFNTRAWKCQFRDDFGREFGDHLQLENLSCSVVCEFLSEFLSE